MTGPTNYEAPVDRVGEQDQRPVSEMKYNLPSVTGKASCAKYNDVGSHPDHKVHLVARVDLNNPFPAIVV